MQRCARLEESGSHALELCGWHPWIDPVRIWTQWSCIVLRCRLLEWIWYYCVLHWLGHLAAREGWAHSFK